MRLRLHSVRGPIASSFPVRHLLARFWLGQGGLLITGVSIACRSKVLAIGRCHTTRDIIRRTKPLRRAEWVDLVSEEDFFIWMLGLSWIMILLPYRLVVRLYLMAKLHSIKEVV